jgi:hypothetical protein
MSACSRTVDGRAIPVGEGQAVFVPVRAAHQFTAYEGLSVLWSSRGSLGSRPRARSRKIACTWANALNSRMPPTRIELVHAV